MKLNDNRFSFGELYRKEIVLSVPIGIRVIRRARRLHFSLLTSHFSLLFYWQPFCIMLKCLYYSNINFSITRNGIRLVGTSQRGHGWWKWLKQRESAHPGVSFFEFLLRKNRKKRLLRYRQSSMYGQGGTSHSLCALSDCFRQGSFDLETDGCRVGAECSLLFKVRS